MKSRAASFAARLVEAGWLVALIAVPLFFDVWSNRVFEPDKLTLLRSLGLLMAAAAVVWWAEQGGGLAGPGDVVRNALRVPLVLPVLALTAAYALSTALSIVPQQSLTGSYQRLQGLYTWLAYVVLFLAVVAFLRRRGQLERLLTAIIVPSLPVALYGIIQNRGLDPMPWLGDVTQRVASTMGNSIFVAAYLILAAPLTLVKIVESLRALDDVGDVRDTGAVAGGRAGSPSSPGLPRHYAPASVLRAAAFIVLFVVQILGLVLSQSRGPLLGLAAAMVVLAVVWAARQPDLRARRRYTGLVYVLLGVLPAAFLLAFNLAPADSAIAALRDKPYIGRMGRVFETEGGTGKVRVLIWQGAIDLVTADPFRTLVGYGPESMHVAYNPYYPAELAHLESRNASPDRSHNETLDMLATTGVLGFTAYLALFTCLFYYALSWLGLIAGSRERGLFLLAWFGGGALAVAAFYLWRGDMTFFGVALPAGMMAGLVHYVVLRALAGRPVIPHAGSIIVAGLTAAVAAHFIEINFGIAIAATRTLFFVMAGALVVVGGLSPFRPALLAEAPEPPPAQPTPVRSPGRRQSPRSSVRAAAQVRTGSRPTAGWMSAGFLMLAVLVTMTFDFFVRGSYDLGDPERFQDVLVMIWLFTLTWAIASLALAGEALMRPGSSLAGLWRYLAVSLGGFAVYAIVHQALFQSGRGAESSSNLLFLFYLGLLAILIGWAAALSRGEARPPVLLAGRWPWLYGLAGVAVAGLVFFTNINEVRADIFYKEAWAGYHAGATQYQAQGDLENAEAYYQGALTSYDRAVGLDPKEDYYLLFKGKALLEQADGLADAVDRRLPDDAGDADFSEYTSADLSDSVKARDNGFARAMTVLESAHTLAAHNTDHAANLGRAYQVWGERTYDAARRADRFGKSRDWFEQAIAQSPNNAGLRTELATTEYLAGHDTAAMAGIDDALAIDAEYGRPYRLRATMYREDKDWEKAEADYRAYVGTRDGKSDAAGWSGLAYVLGQAKKTEAAIVANEKVLELASGDLPTIRNLVLLYRDKGDREGACDYVAQGLEVSPEDETLAQLAADLGCGADSAPAPASSPDTPAAPAAPAGPQAPAATATP